MCLGIPSTQPPHQFGGRVASAEQGAVDGGGVVDADGLAGQIQPVADRFL